VYTHLLVALDGSVLAETVLPAARLLATRLGAAVTLVHLIEADAPEEVHGERHITTEAEGQRYLAGVAATFPPGLVVDTHVHSDAITEVATQIVDHARSLGVDLIVMCTHGHGGLRRWLFGSIAKQVIAEGALPVLLVNPSGPGASVAYAVRRLLAPQDGDPEHAAGAGVAGQLAAGFAAEVHLLMVVPTRGALANEQAATALLLPSATSALLELTEESAQEYLDAQAAPLVERGLAVQAVVRRGDPAPAIAQYAKEIEVDLIVLATHGKRHLDAFWSGSVAPKVSSRTQLPLLLIPVAGED
jgi:nucleotide-binding universal stress UspA family protein